MANSLSASTEGLVIVDQARKRRGWTKTHTARWWQEAHTSRATLRRFWQGDRIQQEIFIALCQTVGIEDWQSIAALPEVPEIHPSPSTPHFDWNEAPNLENFYGRNLELQQLEQWIITDHCRFIILTGMAGMGKTALALALVDRIQQEFDVLIWRSLQTAPSLQKLLDSVLNGFPPDSPIASDTTQSSIFQLMQKFQQYRCLWVLDGLETVLQDPIQHQEYSNLLQCLQRDRHQSHVLVTSRELPPVATDSRPGCTVRHFPLRGLQRPDVVALLQAYGFTGQELGITPLLRLYAGNPLALRLIAPLIQSIFAGKISAFLSQNALIVGDRLQILLKQQLNQLTPLEREIAYWLAIWQEPICFSRLQTHLLGTIDPVRILESIAALEYRSLLEKVWVADDPAFTMQPLVMKVITDELVEQASQEICHAIQDQSMCHFKVIRTHWLLRPGTDDLAGDRILTQLQHQLWQTQGHTLPQSLTQLLLQLDEQPLSAVGYIGCNLMALLKRL